MSNNEVVRQDAESAIRSRLRRSKLVGRGLAAVSVAAGICLGLSHEDDTAQIIASEGALVGVIGVAAVEGRSARKRCETVVSDYDRTRNTARLPLESSRRSVAALPNQHSPKLGEAAATFGSTMMAIMAASGAFEVTSWVADGGPIWPEGFIRPAENFDPGLIGGAAMAVCGIGLLATGNAANSEGIYLNQLNKIDGSTPASGEALA